MAGDITAREGQQAPSEQHNQASAPLRNGRNGNIAGDFDILPATKVPALDTIDQYAIETPLRFSARISSSASLSYNVDISNVAEDIVRGYASFISEFTALDDLAFSITRRDNLWGAGPRSGVICASFSRPDSEEVASLQSQLPEKLQELGSASYSEDEIQFALDFASGVRPENGEQQADDEIKGDVSKNFL